MATTGTVMDRPRRLAPPLAPLRVLPPVSRLVLPTVLPTVLPRVPPRVPPRVLLPALEMRTAVLEQLECKFPCLLDCRLLLLV